MCLYPQAPDEAAESVNLSQSVSIATPEKTAAEGTLPKETVAEEMLPQESEEKNNLPEWSEKVASGILTGEVKLVPAPKIINSFCFGFVLFLLLFKKNLICHIYQVHPG